MRSQTLEFLNKPNIRASAAMAGVKEGEGPLSAHFDQLIDDDLLGQETWELAESEMLKRTVELCLEKGAMLPETVGAAFMGDLLNQIMPSGLAARDLGAPYFGLYGACSTYIEAIILGATMVDGGYLNSAVCAASSHFCTAERQYRFPLELGGQRPPSAQWTATAAGAVLLDSKKERAPVRVTHGTIGRVIDYQVSDANHMGAAMAPAVADTIHRHFLDTGRSFDDYDLIASGDLGRIGRMLLIELLEQRGIRVNDSKLADCGDMLFSPEQDCGAGGSGCGCVASVTSGYILKQLKENVISRALVVGSGALLSPTTSQQGHSIPGIAYATALEGGRA